jgi:hypothetical protein
MRKLSTSPYNVGTLPFSEWYRATNDAEFVEQLIYTVMGSDFAIQQSPGH